MIHVYKAGTTYEKDDKKYDIKAINIEDKAKFLSDGWFASLDEVKKPKAKKAVKKVIADDN